MLKENHDLEGALKKYIVLLKEAEYFEAHEVLEEAWHPLRKADHPLKNLLKGLINGAVAFEHLKRNRKNAQSNARRVMASFERHKHLAREEIVYAVLFEKACQCIEQLKEKHKEVFDVLVP
jgi:predicted metal-dependent hydrolase